MGCVVFDAAKSSRKVNMCVKRYGAFGFKGGMKDGR